MRYYVDKDTMDFLEKDVEAVIYLLKKAYISTKEYYKGKALSDFLYFNTYKTFTNGYCFSENSIAANLSRPFLILS